MSRNLEAVSQFKITTKRSPNSALYRKIGIQIHKISNYGTSSLFRGGEVGAFILEKIIKRRNDENEN